MAFEWFRATGAGGRSCSAPTGSTASSTCTRSPACQNQHWHSDNPTHIAAFWRHPHFMERATALWVQLAARFAGNAWVAGYNLLNEPADPTGEVVGPWHDRTVNAIRAVDPDHILFLDGNTYSTDFSAFGEPFANAIYACHDYAAPGWRSATAARRRSSSRRSSASARRTSARPGRRSGWASSGRSTRACPSSTTRGWRCSTRSSSLYERYGAGWSLWTYKDVGLQGLVYAVADAPTCSASAIHRPQVAARDRLLGLDRPRAARAGRADPRVHRGRVPGLGALPVERAALDRRPAAPHPVRPGDAAGLREAVRGLGRELDALADSFCLACACGASGCANAAWPPHSGVRDSAHARGGQLVRARGAGRENGGIEEGPRLPRSHG